MTFTVFLARSQNFQQASEKSTAKANSSDSDDEVDDVTKEESGEQKQETEPVAPKSSVRDPPLTLRPDGEPYSLQRHLDTHRTRYVVLYHIDLATMRQLEMYKAVNKDGRLRIYVLMYRQSTEEERYLTAVRREQQAFESLIKDQGALMVPRVGEYDTTREPAPRLKPIDRTSTRRAGGQSMFQLDQEQIDRPKVIADMREFSSELPSAVYGSGVDVLPVTLEVGDYVLAPGVCIERKSLQDLVQSLQSGRVFKQAEQMLRHYGDSALLIESSGKKWGGSKRLLGAGPFQGELSKRCREIRSLLTVLVRCQPKLRILWAQDPRASAQLFLEIKYGKEEPEESRAVGIRSDELGDDEDSVDQGPVPSSSQARIDPQAKKMLSFVPGFASGDVERLLKSPLENFYQLSRIDVAQLATYCGDSQTQAQMLKTLIETDFKS